MQQLKDYPILDLSGGLQQDKSPYLLKDSELYVANNIQLDLGRVSKRLGSKQFGAFAVTPDTDEVLDAGIRSGSSFLLANKNTVADSGMIYKLATAFANGDIAAGATIITVDDVSTFAPAGQVEIDGDIITYTGQGAGTLTGCTGVTSSHSGGTAIRQWLDAYAAPTATDLGTWFAYLNGLLVISRGLRGWDTFDGSTMTNQGGSGPFYITTYKQRIYGVQNNSSRVVFSELADATANPTWPTDNTKYFDVEDETGSVIVNLRSYNGRLVIFKTNNTFYYDLSTLSMVNGQVGTFNDKTVQEINGLLYTICPGGAFATNLSSFSEIGEPVKDFLANADYTKYPPRTGRLEDLWVIYLGTVTIEQDTYTDVVLVYNTSLKAWSVWNGFTDFQNFISLDSFVDSYNAFSLVPYVRNTPTLFWGTTTQKLFRMFNDRTSSKGYPSGATITTLGGDILQDKFYDTGSVIPSRVVTKFYHQNAPGWWKQFRYVRVLAEMWPFELECRTQIGNGYSAWKSLGQASGPNCVLPINAEGYAIQFRIGESSKNQPWILNGLILEKTMAVSQNHN